MSRIKEVSAEIGDLKISISEAVVIHALSKLDSTFRPYLAILHHNAREKGKLPTLSKLTMALEDEELRLSNEKRRTSDWSFLQFKAQEKKTKPGEQSGRR